MYEIKVIDEFSGAHRLRGYKGKCESVHGHNWRVEACVYAKALDSSGMVMDFKELKKMLGRILVSLDHKDLNKIPYFRKLNPTSENIARFIHSRLSRGVKKSLKVSVWETSTSSASFED